MLKAALKFFGLLLQDMNRRLGSSYLFKVKAIQKNYALRTLTAPGPLGVLSVSKITLSPSRIGSAVSLA